MKKILLTLLMLMMVVGLFAENSDKVKITAHVDGDTNVRFTSVAFAKTGTLDNLLDATSPDDTSINPVSDNEEERKVSFWVSAHTTASSKVTLKVYGSGLTLVTTSASGDSQNTTYGSEIIPLTVSLVSDEENEAYNYLVPGEESSSTITLNSSASASDSNTFIILTESVAPSSTRGLTKQISVEVANKATEDPAGDYEAFIYLAVSTEG